MADLLARIRAGDIDPVYVLKISEPLLVERAVGALRDRAVPENARGFNYDIIDGRADASRIMAAANTLPMMAQRRMVLVRDLSSLAAAELSKLIAYIEDPTPTTVLVGLCSKVDGRLKFYSRAKKLGFLHDLGAPRQLGPWLAAEAREQGVDIRPAAQRRLLDVVGSDLARLSVALDQLSLYARDRAVEVEDVDDLIATTRERSVFELTDSIGAGDRSRALAAIASLCDQRQSAIGVVMMLARHMRQLAVLKGAQERGVGKGELARVVGAPPFVVDKLTTQARRYTRESLSRALAELARADRQLKGKGGPLRVLGRPLAERVLLEELAGELIALGQR